jgi:hypothetical protein
VLKLWEAMAERAGSRVPQLPDWYLQGDLFCPVIHNFPLARWLEIAEKAGLFLVTSFGVVRNLRPSLPDDQWKRLFPCSRQDLCELTEMMSPAGFHRLLFAKHKAMPPPWQNYDLLKSWRVIETGLYQVRLPRRPASHDRLPVVELRSPAFNALCRWPMPAWEVEILRRRRKALPLGRIISSLRQRVPKQELSQQLFLLWHSGVLNVLEPWDEMLSP